MPLPRWSVLSTALIIVIVATATWMPLTTDIRNITNNPFHVAPLQRSKDEGSSNSSNVSDDGVPVVAYVVTITKCGLEKWKKRVGGTSAWAEDHTLLDAAAVLKHSIQKSTRPLNRNSRYGSKLYAVVYDPDPNSTYRTQAGLDAGAAGSRCESLLHALGYEILRRDIPVQQPLHHLIREFPVMNLKFPGQYPPRPYIEDEPCCGAAEFIKLRSYELVDHPIFVLLDLDSLVLKPLDELFDAMAYPGDDSGGGGGMGGAAAARRHLTESGLVAPTYDRPLPTRIDAFYTKDWCGAKPDLSAWVGVQGGFLVARPSLDVYREFREVLKEGNYVLGNGKGSGWGGKGYGRHIYGSMTFQGLAAYYFEEASSVKSGVELHRCRFNMMADNPRITLGSRFPRATPIDPDLVGYSDGACRDGREDCDDVQCQTWPVEDARSLHFTHCLKPWTCPPPQSNSTVDGTCRKMHREWFRIRTDLESGGASSSPLNEANGTFLRDAYLGYCRSAGADGYVKMLFRDGGSLLSG